MKSMKKNSPRRANDKALRRPKKKKKKWKHHRLK